MPAPIVPAPMPEAAAPARPPAPPVAGGWSAAARQRLWAVATTAVLLGFAATALEVVLPLWATRTLGLSAAQWAQARSLRFTGVLVGVIVLGALADRLGQRLSGVCGLVLAGALLPVLAVGGAPALWLVLPLLGALISTVMVNLNTLTQAVSPAHQGLANTVYRGVGAGAGILAPLAATALAAVWGGYPWVLVVLGLALAAAGVALARYPATHVRVPWTALGAEMRALWRGYEVALRQRPLWRFLHLSQLTANLTAGVGAFAAIRCTRDLGLSDRQFGLLGTAAGVLAFLAITAGVWYLERWSLRALHVGATLCTGLGAGLMGGSERVPVVLAGFLLAVPASTMLVGPGSMWVSRAAGAAGHGAAFSLHKVLAAAYLAGAMALLSVLEAWWGMARVLLGGGVLSVIAAFAFLWLPEPPAPRRDPTTTPEPAAGGPAG